MLICIGGVCVPYTAVIPIAILALKWVVQKLVEYGLMPQFILDKLQVTANRVAETNDACKNDTCKQQDASKSQLSTGPSKVNPLEEDADFQSSLSGGGFVVAKFTAIWCKPCHRIQPVYEQISGMYKGTFWTVDVDDFDELASKYKVSMMPTFVMLQGNEVKGTYSGSDEHQLRNFFKESGIPSM